MSGAPLPFAPEWTLNLDMNYKTSLSIGLMLDLDGNMNDRSETQVSSPENPNTCQDGFALSNSAVGQEPDMIIRAFAAWIIVLLAEARLLAVVNRFGKVLFERAQPASRNLSPG